MSEVSELYQQVILDHNKQPRNFHKLEDANRTADGYNPLCGDQLTVYLRVADGVIQAITFVGSGCAISKASASLMTTLLKGKNLADAQAIFERFHHLVTSEEGDADPDSLGKLAVFAGVREFPARVKCASLAWHTMRSALVSSGDKISTE